MTNEEMCREIKTAVQRKDYELFLAVYEEWFRMASLEDLTRYRDRLYMAVGINPYYYQGQHVPSPELVRVAHATLPQRAEALLPILGDKTYDW